MQLSFINSFTVITVIEVALVCVVCVLMLWLVMLEWRVRRFMRGANKQNIETHLAAIARDYQDLSSYKNALRRELDTMEMRLQGSIRGVGTVRFHPFVGSGSSKPSFATALISEKGDGLIISTLLAHNSASIFSKAIVAFRHEKELTEEEAQALEKARNSLYSTL